jgi:S1-C subfamily serine protease
MTIYRRCGQQLAWAALLCALLGAQPRRTLAEMQRGGHQPPAQPGYLGIDIRDVADDQVAALRLKNTHGAEIISVDHDGPAGKMGLREHDVILQMNGVGVDGREQIRRMLRDTPPGRTIVLVVSREGQALTLTAQMADQREVERMAWEQHLLAAGMVSSPGSLAPDTVPAGPSLPSPASTPKTPATKTANKSFLGTLLTSPTYTGATVEPMSPQLGQFFGVNGRGGLLVRSVANNSPAEMAGLRAGDVVTKANFKAMMSVSAWTKAIKEAKGHPVMLIVVRDRQEKMLTVVPDVKHK